MGRPAKALITRVIRGFKSHPLRQIRAGPSGPARSRPGTWCLHVVHMTAMLRNDDGRTRLRDMRQPSGRRRGQPAPLRLGGADAITRPDLYDVDAEQAAPELESEFWGHTSQWVRREHELVDTEAETIASGIDRPRFDGFDDVDPYDSIADIDQSSNWSSRLGLDQIDPLITRTSMIILVAVLAVPFAWMNREESQVEASPVVVSVPETTLVADLPVVVLSESELSVEHPGPTTPAGVPTAPEPLTSTAVPATQTRTAGPKVSTTTAAASLPTTVAAPVCGSTYVVRPGDSWSLVSDRASISMNELLTTNGVSSRSMLYPDDEICLPPGAVVVIPTTVPRSTAPQTTSAPTTTSTTVVLPPEPSTATAQDIIREVWPDDLEERALEIAHRESRFHANASNWCCVGLFQLHWNAHKGWLAGIGVTSKSQLFDARTNAEAAYALYQRNGWTPWNL